MTYQYDRPYRVAITGADGTGKTTVVRRLAGRYVDRSHILRAFRSPQYHEDPDLPFGALSEAIENLGQLADRLGDARLKASMLFLAMTLYGDIERFVAAAWAPRIVVAERQCLADSLTYAKFYLPLLAGALDREKLAPAIETAGLSEAWTRVIRWAQVISMRAPAGAGWPPAVDEESAAQDIWALPEVVRRVFDRPPAELVPILQELYNADFPDRIILLTATPEALLARLAEKAEAAGSAPRELHEQAQILAMFQAGLAESAAFLATLRPGLAIDRLDTSDLSIEATEDAALALITP